jgi:AraC-like DNA-binding protein
MENSTADAGLSMTAVVKDAAVVAVSADTAVTSLIRRELGHSNVAVLSPASGTVWAAASGADLLIVDLASPGAETRLDLIRELRAKEPHLPIVALAAFTHAAAQLCLLCGYIGVNAIALIGCDNLGEVAERVLVTCGLGSLLMNTLEGVLHDAVPDAAALMRLAFIAATRGEHVKRLCVDAGCSRKTLERRFYSAGLPSPGVTLDWLRTAIAAELVRGGRTPSGAAAALGLSRTASLAAIVRRCVGGSVAELYTQSAMQLLNHFASKVVAKAVKAQGDAQVLAHLS